MNIIEQLNVSFFTPLILAVMVSCGSFFFIKLRMFSPSRLKYAVKALKKGGGGGISASSALSVALAGTLGVGNISGVAVAVSVGGAGAVFWMTVSALFGSVLKYCEAYLSVKYRRKTKNGAEGGSPYYADALCGKKAGDLIAALCIAASFFSGSFIQMNAASTAAKTCFGVPEAATGAVFAVVCLVTAAGGVRRVASFTSAAMPPFCAVFAALSVIAVSMRIGEVPGVIASIFREAFGFRQAAGGFSGAALAAAVRAGLTKGVFSNEAGCGTSSFSHAASDLKEPCAQGLIGVAEVMFDTVVFGGMTALVILLSPGYGSGHGYDGTSSALAAYSSYFGRSAVYILTVLTVFFAFASVLCWGYYGSVCADRLKPGSSRAYLFIYCASLLPGALFSPAPIWQISDLLCALLMTVNCAVMTRGRRAFGKTRITQQAPPVSGAVPTPTSAGSRRRKPADH